MALVLAASPPNLPESTLHDRRSGPRRHRPLLAEDLPRRRSVRARADRGAQRRAPPHLRYARLCQSSDPRPVRRPCVIRKRPTTAVPRGAAERQIPIAPPRRRTLTVPRFPPLEAFGRRPSGLTPPPASGPASETLHNTGPSARGGGGASQPGEGGDPARDTMSRQVRFQETSSQELGAAPTRQVWREDDVALDLS